MPYHPTHQPLALNFKEAAALAGCDPRTISKAVQLGQLVTIPIAGQRLIPRQAFVDYLANGKPFSGPHGVRFDGREVRHG